jgi:hypothetical protein
MVAKQEAKKVEDTRLEDILKEPKPQEEITKQMTLRANPYETGYVKHIAYGLYIRKPKNREVMAISINSFGVKMGLRKLRYPCDYSSSSSWPV